MRVISEVVKCFPRYGRLDTLTSRLRSSLRTFPFSMSDLRMRDFGGMEPWEWSIEMGLALFPSAMVPLLYVSSFDI